MAIKSNDSLLKKENESSRVDGGNTEKRVNA